MMTRRGMHYRCGNCGHHVVMWLDDTLETHDENHKPVPFTISCPNCYMPCSMAHVNWHEDIYLPKPMLLTEDMNRFENHGYCECGCPVFAGHVIPTEEELDGTIQKIFGGEL